MNTRCVSPICPLASQCARTRRTKRRIKVDYFYLVKPKGQGWFCKKYEKLIMINDHLTFSPKGRKLLQDVEALRLKPYADATGKVVTNWCEGATIGFGHLIAKKEWPSFKNCITERQAQELFDRDLQPKEECIKRTIHVSLTQQEFDALIILTFNIGEAGFRSSSVARMINDPREVTKYPTLELAWKAWDKSRINGETVVNKGLANRRACEWNIYKHGIYKRW